MPGSAGSNGVFNRLGNNQNSFQALADNPSGKIAFGARGNQSNRGSNYAAQSPAGQQRGADRSQGRKLSRMSVRDQLTDSLNNMNTKWKLSCFSIAESAPEDRSFEPRNKNEVLGDVSFEEVRWADYQEPNKQLCVHRFADANQHKHTQFQALAQMPRPPSQGGHPLPEPTSPYLNPTQPSAAASPTPGSFGAQPVGPFPPSLEAAPFGMTTQAAPVSALAGQQQFGVAGHPPAQPQPAQAGRIQFGQKAGQASPNPFGSSSHGHPPSFQTSSAQANPFANPFGLGSSQPGRLQFGSRAGQPAAANFGNSSSQGAAAPSSSQSKPVTPFNSTADPFGRQKPGQAQQSAAQVPLNPNAFAQQQQQQSAGNGCNSNPFGQQQPPATPAGFGAFGGPQAFQSQPSQGLEFQTPAVQQRPAFGGGVAASLQTPSPGGTGLADQAVAGTGNPAGTISNGQSAPEVSAWTATEFVIGKIPEDPPPFELCH
ncbi:hypothetical protein ABBQ32_005679 [Trebouxia sp. C0010 RCD-2024]